MTAFLPAYAAALVLAVLLALVDSVALIALGRDLAQRYRAEDKENYRTARRHERGREQYERT